MTRLHPTLASRWRFALAHALAARYARNAHVAGVLVGGSTARGQADRFSDLELMVLWSTPPSDDDRRAVVDAVGGDLHRLYPYDEAAAVWEDVYFLGRDTADRAKSGCLVEVSHHRVATLNARVGHVVDQAGADEALLNLMAGIADGHILAGEPVILPLQDRLARYPDALQQAVVRRYGYIDHFWRWEMYAARRNNVPEAYALFTTVVHRVVHLLLAVNRRYFGGWKWLASMVEQCPLAPERAVERIQTIYQVPLREGAPLLAHLVDDTFDLVERHVVGVDVAGMRALFHWQRPQWDGPPPRRWPAS